MKTRLLIKLTLATTCLCLVFVSSGIGNFMPSAAKAESTIWQKIRRIFTGPQRIGSGTDNKPAQVQDRCPFIAEFAPKLTALVPSTTDNETYLEQSVSTRPNFWFYVPYTAQHYRDVEFVLINEQEEDIYRAQFPLTNSVPAILNIRLPYNVVLTSGKKYQWVFSIICNPANRSGDATVHSWVQRLPISSELSIALREGSTRQTREDQILAHTLAYADAEIWFETLSTLGTAFYLNPDNDELKVAWQELLGSVNLSELANAPVVPCCITPEGEATSIPPNATLPGE
jgi:Domain of Unknown Function (DUF928)